ncbi:MAG: hypothetical protein IJX37_09190 [Oscillospiraceae bacterium]|nr:hypothetical protein [Oscillospiraceae bacterium]
MESKLFEKNCITLDGRLDEPVWATAKEYTGFSASKAAGGGVPAEQTFFKILPCEDRVYFGLKCMEPDMERVLAGHGDRCIWETDSLELFLSPSGDTEEFYQFVLTLGGETATGYFAEGGNIRPDPYAPDWKTAVYVGEDYWTAEIEIPYTAFYMTTTERWSQTWLMNIGRSRVDYNDRGETKHYTWSQVLKGFLDTDAFRPVEGFGMRPACDDLRMVSAAVDITESTDKGYCGTLTVKTLNEEAGEFVFTSDYTEPAAVSLKAGSNEFSVPCRFAECKRHQISLCLTRTSDGVVFKRGYPVRVAYEPIKLALTLPEYRGNFYPGQDYSKVVGKVTAAKPVTVTLEGPGIGTKTVTPDAEGNFAIETPNFEIGDAMLTVTDSENTLTKKIRRLAPTGRMMTWISGGNLIVGGKPVLRRNMYADYYMGGEAFKLRYDADNLYQTMEIRSQTPMMAPGRLIKGSESPAGEATKDIMPSDEMFRKVEAIIEGNRDRDFAYYYLDDEPECRNVSPIYLKHLYDFICDKDPYHVVLMASRGAGDYIYCADWIETHAYINPLVRDGKRYYDRPIYSIGKYVDDIVKLNKPDKCIGFMPTCFQSGSVFSVYPTFDEMICHSWAAIVAGARTLWSYAYHDLNDRASLYEGSRYVNAGLEALQDFVLLGKRTDIVRNQKVHAALFETGSEKMLAVVNFTQEPQQVTLDGISGTWHHFRHKGTLTGNTFLLKPLEVLVGTSQVKDADIPTYDETAALIDKLEYRRTHSGSLLFERYSDIAVTASSPAGKRKMFDGIRDNLGWTQSSGDGKFYEINLTRANITFSKVVVYGFQIDDMTIKVREGETLSTPAIAEVKTEEYATTFILSEPISPDALRLEFGQRRVELYEIEVF